jgi:polyisoprenoid-binding protein YceI
LKGADYFDVEKFPKINFTSKSITKIDAKNYNMNGDLTMHGVTKPISLKLVLNGVGKNMRTQKPLAGFKVTGTINRKDFGVSNAPGAMLSEDIEIRAVGELNKE